FGRLAWRNMPLSGTAMNARSRCRIAIRTGLLLAFAMAPAVPLPRIAAANKPPAPQVIEPRLVHLRSGDAREWSSFPEQAEGRQLIVRFAATVNEQQAALRLRQHDVKSRWRALLNDK